MEQQLKLPPKQETQIELLAAGFSFLSSLGAAGGWPVTPSLLILLDEELEREQESEIFHLVIHPSRWLWRVGPDQANARIQELHLDFPDTRGIGPQALELTHQQVTGLEKDQLGHYGMPALQAEAFSFASCHCAGLAVTSFLNCSMPCSLGRKITSIWGSVLELPRVVNVGYGKSLAQPLFFIRCKQLESRRIKNKT